MKPSILILVVDDEELVLQLVQDALEDAGFGTQAAMTGEEAVSLLESDSEIRALVTDINLQGKLTGWEVARKAREQVPELPVVYCTGDSAHEWPSEGVPNSVLIPKPFAAGQVVTAVSQLMTVGNGSGPATPPPAA